MLGVVKESVVSRFTDEPRLPTLFRDLPNLRYSGLGTLLTETMTDNFRTERG